MFTFRRIPHHLVLLEMRGCVIESITDSLQALTVIFGSLTARRRAQFFALPIIVEWSGLPSAFQRVPVTLPGVYNVFQLLFHFACALLERSEKFGEPESIRTRVRAVQSSAGVRDRSRRFAHPWAFWKHTRGSKARRRSKYGPTFTNHIITPKSECMNPLQVAK